MAVCLLGCIFSALLTSWQNSPIVSMHRACSNRRQQGAALSTLLSLPNARQSLSPVFDVQTNPMMTNRALNGSTMLMVMVLNWFLRQLFST